jgi:predicted DNA-binding WGR domain protein
MADDINVEEDELKKKIVDRYFVFVHRNKRKFYAVVVRRAKPFDVEKWELVVSYGDLRQDGTPPLCYWDGDRYGGTDRKTYYDSRYVAMSEAEKRCESTMDKGYQEVQPGQEVLAFGANTAMVVTSDEVATEETVKKKRTLLRE